jgi:cytochrome c biogenesis protein CcdA
MLPACKSWNLIVMGGLEQASLADIIFLSIVEAKARWKAILIHYLKNWMQKDKDKWPPDRLSWKKQAHSLMKQSISHLGAPCTSMAIGIKWCPSWNPLYLWILTMALNSAIALASQLMTLKVIISHIKSITTTSATKT